MLYPTSTVSVTDTVMLLNSTVNLQDLNMFPINLMALAFEIMQCLITKQP